MGREITITDEYEIIDEPLEVNFYNMSDKVKLAVIEAIVNGDIYELPCSGVIEVTLTEEIEPNESN